MKFYEAVKKAKEVVDLSDGKVQSFQTWRCAHCGSKNTMAEANTFFIAGYCDDCDHLTDMQTEGCSFMLEATTQLRLPL